MPVFEVGLPFIWEKKEENWGFARKDSCRFLSDLMLLTQRLNMFVYSQPFKLFLLIIFFLLLSVPFFLSAVSFFLPLPLCLCLPVVSSGNFRALAYWFIAIETGRRTDGGWGLSVRRGLTRLFTLLFCCTASPMKHWHLDATLHMWWWWRMSEETGCFC